MKSKCKLLICAKFKYEAQLTVVKKHLKIFKNCLSGHVALLVLEILGWGDCTWK